MGAPNWWGPLGLCPCGPCLNPGLFMNTKNVFLKLFQYQGVSDTEDRNSFK
jgi:hypothetical protein